MAKKQLKQVSVIGKAAATDVAVILAASNDLQVADKRMQEVMIARGVELHNPKCSVDEKGLHAKHRTYLEEFDKAMRVARKCGEKADGYTRRLKSEFLTVLSALQVNEIVLETKQDDGKIKKDAVVVADYLKEAGKLSEMVFAARRIRKQAGIGKKDTNGTVREIKMPTLIGLLDNKLKGRLHVKGLLQVIKFIGTEAEQVVLPDNKVMFRKIHEAYAGEMVKLLTETQAAPKQEADVNAAAGKPEKQRQVANISKARKAKRIKDNLDSRSDAAAYRRSVKHAKRLIKRQQVAQQAAA